MVEQKINYGRFGAKFKLTIEHDFPCPLLLDVGVGGAVCHGPLLTRVALVQTGRVDLEHVRRPE